MNQKKKVEWTKLDNASKIFPATCSYKDTKVFRFTCELHETVDADILQEALDVTIEKFPLYRSVLRRGIFWYYFESSDIKPVVEIESNPICASIYFKEKKNLLFRVFYYNRRISIEVFHALSDGKGALGFMHTLVSHYLFLKYRDVFAGKIPQLTVNASISEKKEDSFEKYFAGGNVFKAIKEIKSINKNKKAYHIKGTRMEENRIKVIEGSMSAKAVLEEAHSCNTTLTIFITALFMYSIYKHMPALKKDRPVVLLVPVNLRQFFKSETTRNFFSTISIGYEFEGKSADFIDVINSVSASFKKELTEEQMIKHLSRYILLEKNPFTRVAPLPIKDFFIRIANSVNNRNTTAAISNLGRIEMPVEFDDYIRQFSVFTGVIRPQISMCTYKDRLVVSFNSPFGETDIQRTFFNYLTSKGIEIEISTNLP